MRWDFALRKRRPRGLLVNSNSQRTLLSERSHSKLKGTFAKSRFPFSIRKFEEVRKVPCEESKQRNGKNLGGSSRN